MIPESVTIIVAHGSRSRVWVETVRAWHREVASGVEAAGQEAPLLAFLEISEPLLETVAAGLEPGTAIRIFPFFLGRTGHVAEDIPEILGEHLPAGCTWSFLDTHGWHEALGRNAALRLARYGAQPGDPVAVAVYGSVQGEAEWTELVDNVRRNTGVYAQAPWHWAAMGHFLEDYNAPLRDLIATYRQDGHRRVAVLPLFLSVSSYQTDLIPAVIAEFPDMHFLFQPDSVLPDAGLVEWAVSIVNG